MDVLIQYRGRWGCGVDLIVLWGNCLGFLQVCREDMGETVLHNGPFEYLQSRNFP